MAKIGGGSGKMPEYKIGQYGGYLQAPWEDKPEWRELRKSLKKSSKPILGRGYGGPEEGSVRHQSGRRAGEMYIPTQKKSLKAEKLLAEAIKKNPEAKTWISKLKKLLPGVTGQTVLLDLFANPGTANAPSTASTEDIEKVAQFMFENGGRWPDQSFKEGYRGDKMESLLMYKAMVEESALQQMAEQSDMKTQEKMQFYNPDQQKSFQEKSAEFLRNM